jgi:tetratricopeptide (TPR) repeat protein
MDLALGVLMQGLENNPHDEDLLYQVGALYDLMGDHDLAVAQMGKILAQNPKSARALNFIGYSWADRGLRLDEAEKLIRHALELEPDNGAIIDSLGWVFYQRKDYKKALNYLVQAIDKMPEDPEILTHLGDVYSVQGQKKKALEYYRKALESLKDNPRPGLADKIKLKIEKLKGI